MSEQPVGATAALTLTWRVDLLLTLVAPVASGTRALLIVTLVDFRVGITQLDGDVALELVLEADSLDTGDGLDDGRLSVSDVADGANVDGGLAGDNVVGQRVQRRNVEVLRVRLRRELRALNGRGRRSSGLLQRRLAGLCVLLGLLRLLNLRVVEGLVVLDIRIRLHDCDGRVRRERGEWACEKAWWGVPGAD